MASIPIPSSRKYDLVNFGATGYTGKLTSEQILLSSPSTLKWAIAGRSLQKLELLAADYNKRFPDRHPVDVFISDLSEDGLKSLAQSTRCLISTVGPYIKYGTPVVAACASNGTHYVDSTGETPWVKKIIDKYHETARRNGAILIPQCGVESAPAELSTYSLVKIIREKFNCPVADIVYAMHDVKSGVSGGTLETVFCVFESCSIMELMEASKPYFLSPVKGPDVPHTFPIRQHEELGLLTMWIQAPTDLSLVMRGWGLYGGGEYYGKRFTFKEYRQTSNWFTAVGWVCLCIALSVLPLIPPLRWIARKLVIQPGDGPTAERMSAHRAEWRGVAEADDGKAEHRKAYVSFRSEKDCYTLTGILLAQTALSILFNEDSAARKMGGGILTPSTIATEKYIRDLDKAGVHIETKLLD